jgi:hypothetical protein
MKDTQSVKKPPLMYISQPNFQPTSVNMQHSISIKKETAIYKHEVPKEDKSLAKDQKVVDEQKSKKKSSQRRRFPELTIREKVELFAHLPVNVPRSTCEIKTGTNTYRGKIASLNDDIVTVRTLKEPYKVELQIEEIQSINIISL